MARCTNIIKLEEHEPRYFINIRQTAKFIVELADTVSPTDIEEGMRVGVSQAKYKVDNNCLKSDI